MAKSSYSDQEMRQVLNALYKEKKKANEIASKLQEKSDESSRLKTELQKSQEDSNVDRLQQLLATYKEKFENAKDDADSNTLEMGALKENLAEFAYLQEENKALLQQIVKLKERAGINSPNPNATQNQLEIFQLKEDVQQAQNQALRDKQKIEKLLQQVSDKERKLQDVVSIEEALKRASEKKKQLEESIVLLEERAVTAEKSLQEIKSHSDQLERAISFLRERGEEAKLEANELREEYQKSLLIINQQKQELDDAHNSFDKVENDLKQRAGEDIRSQEEVEMLQKQLQGLKDQLLLSQKQCLVTQKLLDESVGNHNIASSEKGKLELSLKEKQMLIVNFEKELALLKQSLFKGLKETQELTLNFQEMIRDKVAAQTKTIHAQRQIEKLQHDLKSHQILLQQAEVKQQTLQNQIVQMETLHYQNEEKEAELNNALHLKNQEVTRINSEVDSLRDEIKHREKKFREQEHLIEEKENELVEAQHHLTKKVKEVARFEEDNEELQHKIVEMSEGATKEVLRSTELQSALEVQQKKYLQLQDEFGNYKQNSDFQQSQLETKITSITQKWQNAESRLNELEDLERRYKDLQEALTKLSPLLNPVAAKSASHVKPAIHDQHTEAPKDSPEDLFGYKKQQQKMKQSFLE